MKNLLIVLSITVVTLITSACQPVNPDQLARERAKFGNQSNQPKQGITTVSISGNWEATCVQDSNKNQYRVDSLQITSNYVVSNSDYFTDPKCQIPLYNLSVGGLYQLNDDSVHGFTSLSVTLESVSILPQTTAAVNQFVGSAFCRTIDWKLGMLRTFPDASVCGLALTSTNKIERYGQDELYLAAQKFLKK